jgi:hypothetical protein
MKGHSVDDFVEFINKWLADEGIDHSEHAAERLLERMQTRRDELLRAPLSIGAKVRHRMNQQIEMMIIDIEGEPAVAEWFTGRTKDLQTWRMRRQEVELLPPVNDTEARSVGGQYL